MTVILEMANNNNKLNLICKSSKSFPVVLFITADILKPQNKQGST